MSRPITRGTALAAAVLALTGCSTATLRVTPPDPAPNEISVCRDLHAHLPGTVHGQPERETAPESDLTAAWGDIVLRCGVDRPEALEPTSELYTIQQVEWFVQELTKGTRFTAVGREAYVEIDVAEKYAPEADVLTDLAGPIREHVPES